MITVTQYKAELKQAQEPEQKNSLDIHIYDVVQGDSYNFWTGETIESETSAKHVRNVLTENEDVENINIYINSVGGSVYEGLAIYNQLKRHKAYKTVYVDGMACSIASVIAMAGDKVIMPKASMLMIHNAWSCACGNAEELRKAADDLDVMSETLAQAYLAKSGGILAYDELKALMDKETIMPATQAHEYGLCDVVEDDTSAEDKAKAAVRNAMNSAMAMAMNRAHMMPEAHDEAEETAEEKAENESTVAENAQVENSDCAENAQTETESQEETPCDKNEALETFMNYFSRKAVC